MNKFLSNPDQRNNVSVRENQKPTMPSIVHVREVPLSAKQLANLEAYSTAPTIKAMPRVMDMPSRVATVPATPAAVAQSRALGFQGVRIS